MSFISPCPKTHHVAAQSTTRAVQVSEQQNFVTEEKSQRPFLKNPSKLW
jgi:hypothetical protein